MINSQSDFNSLLLEINNLIKEKNYENAEKKIKKALGATPPQNIQLELYGRLLVIYYRRDDLKNLIITFREMENKGFITAVSDAVMVLAFKEASGRLINRRCQQLDIEHLKKLKEELENFECYDAASLIDEEIAKRKVTN